MQPSDSLDSFSRGFGSPCQRPTSWDRRLFCRLRRRLTHAPAYALDPKIDHRLSVQPETPEERQGPPGLLGRPLRTCRGATLRRTRNPPNPLLNEKLSGEIDIVFAKNRTLDIRNDYSFRSHLPTAHTFACLRFADRVTEIVARLATGSGGLTPDRAGFAPAGQQTKFHGDIAIPPIPIDLQSLVALKFLFSFSRGWRWWT